MLRLPGRCPACDVSMVGERIPGTVREVFGQASNYTRWCGVYVRGGHGVVELRWSCPDCGHVLAPVATANSTPA